MKIKSYILLAAIAADRLNIGTELIMKRSSCQVKEDDMFKIKYEVDVATDRGELPCEEA